METRMTYLFIGCFFPQSVMADCQKPRTRWTEQEETVLIQTVLACESVLFGSAVGSGKTKISTIKEKKWKEVADVLNSQFITCKRSWREVKKKFQNMKHRAKTRIDDVRRPATGGGPAPPGLSAGEELLLAEVGDRAGMSGIPGSVDTDELVYVELEDDIDEGELLQPLSEMQCPDDQMPSGSGDQTHQTDDSLATQACKNSTSGSLRTGTHTADDSLATQACKNSTSGSLRTGTHTADDSLATQACQNSHSGSFKTGTHTGKKKPTNTSLSIITEQTMKIDMERIKLEMELMKRQIEDIDEQKELRKKQKTDVEMSIGNRKIKRDILLLQKKILEKDEQ